MHFQKSIKSICSSILSSIAFLLLVALIICVYLGARNLSSSKEYSFAVPPAKHSFNYIIPGLKEKIYSVKESAYLKQFQTGTQQSVNFAAIVPADLFIPSLLGIFFFLGWIISHLFQNCSKKEILHSLTSFLQKERQELGDELKRMINNTNSPDYQVQFQHLYEHMPLGFLVYDLKGRIMHVNTAAENILESSSGQLFGNKISDPMWIYCDSNSLPLAIDEHPMHLALKSGTIVKDKIVGIRKAATSDFTWLLLSAVPQFHEGEDVPYQICVLFSDITRLKKAKDACSLSEDRYKLVSENIPVVVYSALPDEHYSYNYLSSRVLDLTGYSGHECMNNPELWNEIVHPDDRKKYWDAVKKNNSEKQGLDVIYRIVTKSGAAKWIRDKATAQVVEGETVSIEGLMEDVTEEVDTSIIIENSQHERELLIKELYHRTKNNMQVISAILGLQATLTHHDEVKHIFKDMESRIRSMALVHQKLYQADNLSKIDLGEYVKDLGRILLSNHKMGSEDIEIHFECDSIDVSVDIAVPCGLVINELITNAFKHAFPEDCGGRIEINLNYLDESISLKVRDNGCGLSGDMYENKSNTLGLQTVLMIVEQQLQGALSYDGNNGVAWNIDFPIASYSKKNRNNDALMQ